MESTEPRRSSRVLMFDHDDKLVLIRRTRPDVAPYLTTPGGGVEPGETWDQAAVRECREELGADVIIGSVAYVIYPEAGHGSIQRFAVARLISLDESRRDGPEFLDPSRGGYATVHYDLADPALDQFRPPELITILRHHGPLFAAEARTLANPSP